MATARLAPHSGQKAEASAYLPQVAHSSGRPTGINMRDSLGHGFRISKYKGRKIINKRKTPPHQLAADCGVWPLLIASLYTQQATSRAKKSASKSPIRFAPQSDFLALDD
jgi:hypothetical protein